MAGFNSSHQICCKQESIQLNFVFLRNPILLLSLSFCNVRKKCVYYEMAKLNIEKLCVNEEKMFGKIGYRRKSKNANQLSSASNTSTKITINFESNKSESFFFCA